MSRVTLDYTFSMGMLVIYWFSILLVHRMATVGQFTAEQAMRLLDFSGKIDMTLLDTVVNCFYNTVGPEVSLHCNMACIISLSLSYTQQQIAQQVLTQFREHPDAWTQVDTILELSQNQETKVKRLWRPNNCRDISCPLQSIHVPPFTVSLYLVPGTTDT